MATLHRTYDQCLGRIIYPQAKCNLFKGSLSFSGVIVWNSIPVNIKNSQSLDIFVERCTYWIKH